MPVKPLDDINFLFMVQKKGFSNIVNENIAGLLITKAGAFIASLLAGLMVEKVGQKVSGKIFGKSFRTDAEMKKFYDMADIIYNADNTSDKAAFKKFMKDNEAAYSPVFTSFENNFKEFKKDVTNSLGQTIENDLQNDLLYKIDVKKFFGKLSKSNRDFDTYYSNLSGEEKKYLEGSLRDFAKSNRMIGTGRINIELQ